MVQTAGVAGLRHLGRGPDGGQATAREIDGRPGRREAGVCRLMGSGGVGLLDWQGSVVAGPVVWLGVRGGLEVLLKQK